MSKLQFQVFKSTKEAEKVKLSFGLGLGQNHFRFDNEIGPEFRSQTISLYLLMNE